jgi:DNA invertase Pin-like site-specific DNA recombinase
MSNRELQPTNRTLGWVEYVRDGEEFICSPEHSTENQSRLNHAKLIDGSELSYRGQYSDIFDEHETADQGFQRLLADAQLGKFSHIAIAYVHIFGKTDAEIRQAFDSLIALGLTIRIATYPSLHPEEPDGRLIIDVLLSMAQYESARIARVMQEHMQQRGLSAN